MNEEINNTLEFDDSPEVKGWTSFFTYTPDMMVGMNNKFFSFRNGDLYEHHLGDRNTFYGVTSPTRVSVIFNEHAGDDKIFKTIFLESNLPWDITLETNYTNSTIKAEEFKPKESRWFAFTRRSEDSEDLTGISVTGIGNLRSFDGNVASFSQIDTAINIGDALYQINNNEAELLGRISAKTPYSITLDLVSSVVPVIGSFCFSKKNPRIESSSLRGYYMKAELSNDHTEHVELFAINSKAVKSYV